MPISDDYKKFSILMAMLATAFSDKGIIQAKIDLYWEYLKDIDIDRLAEAVSVVIKTRKFSTLPTIAELREAALGRDDEIETGALEAWGQACYAVERGFYSQDPVITEAVRIAFGGWEKFGETDPENGVADRAHFIRVFKGLARSRRDRGGLALDAESHRPLPKGQEIVKRLMDKFGK